MKRFFTISLILMLITPFVSAQNFQITKNDLHHLTIHFTTGDLSAYEFATPAETFTRIEMEGYQTAGKIGTPELPSLVKMIETPLCANLRVTTSVGKITKYAGEELGVFRRLYPVQPPVHKSEEASEILQIDAKLYKTNAFHSNELVSVTPNGIMRCYNLASITINPVEYNPVTNEFIIYEDITVDISYENADIPATQAMRDLHSSPAFAFPTQIINTLPLPANQEFTSTPIKYLIIANDMFNGHLDTFINWKRRKGFLVEVAYTGTIGNTTAAIKSYIQGLYTNATPTNPAPTYVLIVGDVAQVPTFRGSAAQHATDLYYFTWTAGDDLPDCYYGRFSAQTVAHLNAQVEKTIAYEMVTMGDPTYLDHALLVAGVDRGTSGDWGYSHANPSMHYLADNYVNSNYGFTTVNAYYNPHNNSSTTNVRSALNGGTGYANYSAHCSSTGWSDPSFTISQVSSMSNTGKYGLMIGNCCQSSTYDNNECFSEALLRAPNKGAVGYIGASDYTYWDEDYYWAVGLRSLRSSCSNCNSATYDATRLGAYDQMFHTHNEPYNKWFITQGSMIFAGNTSVQSSTSNLRLYYWEAYNLIGDPSVMPWLTQPDNMTLTLNGATAETNNIVIAGTTSLTVNTGAPYSYIALTRNLQLVAATMSDANGLATLNFPSMNVGETYELAASAQNYKTTFATITAIAPDGANVRVVEVNPNNGSLFAIGSSVSLDVIIANEYPETATNAVITATSSSSLITLTDSREQVGTVPSETRDTLRASFSLNIGYAANGTVVPITFKATFLNDGEADSTTFTYPLVINAPEFAHVDMTYSILTGNNDAIINPGETIEIHITNQNVGAVTANQILSELSTYYLPTPITQNSNNINTLQPQAQSTSTFTMEIGNNVPNGTIVPIYHHIYCTNYPMISNIDTLYLTIGSAEITEDWESNSFATHNWNNNSEYPWTLVNSGAYEGTYCAKSGNYGVDNSSSVLSKEIYSAFDGEVTYYKKVSSESNYDIFEFYIDDNLMEEVSGNRSWSQSRFPITAGNHTLTFVYKKDVSFQSGSDCAWIDNITWPENTMAPMNDFIQIVSANVSATTPAVYGADITFDAVIENISDTNIAPITLELTTRSPYVTINQPTTTLANLTAGERRTATDLFASHIHGNLTEEVTVPFTLTATYAIQSATCVKRYDFDVTLSPESSAITDYDNSTFRIYPNPTQNSVTLVVDQLQGETQYTLFDMHGKQLKQGKVNSIMTPIDLSHFAKGVYFIQIKSGKQVLKHEKIIKK